tara:strand:- start:872 stop:1489 length:618 start_codon:yes stop_codon:yes gene_type:complete
MSRTINLYGHLKQETGYKSIEANVFSIREAVDFLVCNWPSLQAQILNNKYHVLVDDVDVEEDYLLKPLGKSSISFIPVVEGTGNFGRIILGAALIGLSLGTFGITLGSGSIELSKAGLSFANASIYSKAAFYVGAALVLSGVSGLLTPTPEIPSDEQKPESSAFSSPLNTSFPGVAIPLAYGTIMVGSVVINTNVVIGDLPEVQE